MTHEKHREERYRDAHRTVREQRVIPRVFQQEAGEDGGNNLRRHGESIIEARVFSHVRSLGKLHYHGVGIDVDGRPGDTRQRKERKHTVVEGPKEHRRAEGKRQPRHAAENGLAPADALAQRRYRQIGADRCGLRDDQRVGKRAACKAPIGPCILGKRCRDRVIPHKPEEHRGQYQHQRPLFGSGKTALRNVLRPLFLLGLILDRHSVFADGQRQDRHRNHHHDGRSGKHGGVVRIFGLGHHHGDEAQRHHAADRAHEVDDGVRA